MSASYLAVCVGATIGLLAGCSGSSPVPIAGATSSSGFSPGMAARAHYLYVSNAGNSVTVLSAKSFQHVGEISDGLNGADGLWVDTKGNFYVANYSAPNVTEYKPGASKPSCTYSAQLVDPTNVTTDTSGNVYVVDLNYASYPGYIYKYAQCEGNVVAHSYTIDVAPSGVAVDAQGDVFVSYASPYGGGHFEEFTNGGSFYKILGATVGKAGGLLIDARGNLIADDQSGSIDLIAPPYATGKLLIGGLNDPFHCSLNRSEDLLFSADHGSKTVTIYEYPSGKLVKTLDKNNGIYAAEGVAVSPDAVF